MYKGLDLVILACILGLWTLRHTRYWKFKKSELPFIVLIYLVFVPYRGYMARSMPHSDLIIDLLLMFEVLCIFLRERIRLCSNYLIWFVGFFVAAICYAVNTSGFFGIFGIQELKFYFGNLLLITVITSRIRGKQSIYEIINIFIKNSVIISLIDLCSYSIFRYNAIADVISNRNFVSIYCFLGLVSIVYKYRKFRNRKYFIAAGIVLLDILLMGSSSVFMALILLLGVWGARKLSFTTNSTYKLIILALICVVVGTIYLTVAPDSMNNRLINAVQSLRSSGDYTRVLIWDEALEIAKNNLVYGIGPDNFRDSRTLYNFPTHNDYLKILVETGLIGLFSFLAFLSKSFYDLWRINDNRIKRYYFCGMVGLLIFILFHGYINYTPFWIVFCIPFWHRNIVQNNEANCNAEGDCLW